MSCYGGYGDRGRIGRALRLVARIFAIMVVFGAALVLGVIAHLGLPATRRVVAAELTALLDARFAGEIAVERIGRLGVRSVSGVRLRASDPDGVEVLFVDGLRARFGTLDALASLLLGKGTIDVDVHTMSIDYAVVNVDDDGRGQLRLANALARKTEEEDVAPSGGPASPPARVIRIEAPASTLRRAWIHGRPPGAPTVDADLTSLTVSAHADRERVRAVLRRAEVLLRGLPRGAQLEGVIAGHASMPSDTGQPVGLDLTFDGAVAGVPTIAAAHLDGENIEASIDAHDVSGRGLRSTFDELDVREDITLQARARGELRRLSTELRLWVGPRGVHGAVDVAARVDLRDGRRVLATLDARHVDLHALFPSAPRSDIGMRARGSLTSIAGHPLRAEMNLSSSRATLAGVTLPAIRAHADVADGAVHATAEVTDPRVRAALAIDVSPARTPGERRIVEVQLRAEAGDLSILPLVGVGGANASGRASLTAHLRAGLDGRAPSRSPSLLYARLDLRGEGLSYERGRIDDLRAIASTTGPSDKPLVDLAVHGEGVRWGNRRASAIDFQGLVEAGKPLVIREAHVDLVEAGIAVSATADRFEIGEGRAAIDHAVVEGLGDVIRGSLQADRRTARISIDAPRMELAQVASLLGEEWAVRDGVLGVQADVSVDEDTLRGQLHLNVEKLTARSIDGASGTLDAELDGRDVTLRGASVVEGLGRAEIATSRLTLAGPPRDLRSWTEASGRVRFDATFGLSSLSSFAHARALPVGALDGEAHLLGAFARERPGEAPQLSVHAETRGLAVSGPTTVERSLGDGAMVGPWRVSDVDLAFDLRWDAISGQLAAAVRALDHDGLLVAVDAKAIVPYASIVAGPSRALAALEAAPVAAKVIAPRRPFARLPALPALRVLAGTFDFEGDVSGTALAPRVRLSAHARGLRAPFESEADAADADLTLHYDEDGADLTLNARAEDREVLAAATHVDVSVSSLFEPPVRPLEWKARGRVRLVRFSLATIDAFTSHGIRGRISGDVRFEDLHRDAKMSGRFAVDDLRIGGATYPKGRLTVEAKAGRLGARARLDQLDGYADLDVSTAIRWGADLTPTIDPSGPADARLNAKAFRIAVLGPFVSDVIDQLDGRVSGAATLHVDGNNTAASGSMSFYNGTARLVAGGPLMTDVQAQLSVDPDGRIQIADLRAKGGGGELRAKGVVQMHGVAFGSADATFTIPGKAPMDLALARQPIGEVAGTLSLHAEARDGDRIAMNVEVPGMTVSVPAAALKAGVHEPSRRDDVHVGVFTDGGTFVVLPMDREDFERKAPAARTGVHLDVDVRLASVTVVYGRTARIVLRGEPRVRFVDGTTSVTGSVEATQGMIEIQGKEFDVEKATVTFRADEPSNPTVVATASWTAPDGTRIFADFAGPLATGRMELRSEPPRPKNEILALIVFGTAEGVSARPAAPGSTIGAGVQAAATVGGALAGQGLTEAIRDLTGARATARVDTSRARSPATELEIELSQRVSVELSHVFGTPPLSRPDKNLVSFEWRVGRRWSLETTVGDRGSVQMDAIWQKRY